MNNAFQLFVDSMDTSALDASDQEQETINELEDVYEIVREIPEMVLMSQLGPEDWYLIRLFDQMCDAKPTADNRFPKAYALIRLITILRGFYEGDDPPKEAV